MSDNRGSSGGLFVGGVVIGAVVGAVAGLLAAPRTGRETRQFLKKSADALPELAEDLSTSVQIQADRLSETALRNWDGTLNRLREAITVGLEASQRELQDIKPDMKKPDTMKPDIKPVEKVKEPRSNGDNA